MAIGVIFNFPGGTTAHGQGRGRSHASFRRTWAFIFWRLFSIKLSPCHAGPPSTVPHHRRSHASAAIHSLPQCRRIRRRGERAT